MAQKVIHTLVDDIDGSEASQTVLFALDGKSYEIDLNDPHAEELREALAPYLGAARKTGGGRAVVRRIGTTKPAEDSGAIRVWARENGYEVSDRGRVPATIREAYEKAKAA
ncbi:Lsr2 family protein [Streptomyces sp. NPDC051014]|uniref:histone-like nucleoid-structuring protein Lsr2 n=1 Tax=Streptomyces sp. NPDC051014 TaxID=3155751 RepID=UPI0033CE60AE